MNQEQRDRVYRACDTVERAMRTALEWCERGGENYNNLRLARGIMIEVQMYATLTSEGLADEAKARWVSYLESL